jgi:hypothetical protein
MSVQRPAVPLVSLERRDLLAVAGIWAVWSLATLLFAWMAAMLPGGDPSPWDSSLTATAPPLARWDAGWYRDVAHSGYRYNPDAPTNNVRFYPLYPLAMRIVSGVTGISLFRSAVLISIACLLPALILLADFVRRERGGEGIGPVLTALLFFPTAFYFAAAYSESLFLLTTIAAFWAARQGRWLFAGIAGAAASATRLNGVLILVPMAYLAWKEWQTRSRRAYRAPAALLLGLAGAAAYPVFLWQRFGSPLVYFHIGYGWTHKPTPPWVLARRVGSELLARVKTVDAKSLTFLLCFGCVVLFGALTVALLLRGPADSAAYVFATMLLLASSGSIDAVPRYVLPLFPCFMLLGNAMRRSAVLRFAYSFVGLGLYGVLLHRFVRWIWVA